MTTVMKWLGLRVFTVTKNHQCGLDFPEPLSIISSELMGFGGSESRKLGSENKFILFSSASGFCGFAPARSAWHGAGHPAPGLGRRLSWGQGLEGDGTTREWHEGGGGQGSAPCDLDLEVAGAESGSWPNTDT